MQRGRDESILTVCLPSFRLHFGVFRLIVFASNCLNLKLLWQMHNTQKLRAPAAPQTAAGSLGNELMPSALNVHFFVFFVFYRKSRETNGFVFVLFSFFPKVPASLLSADA